MFRGITVNEIWRKRYNKELMGIIKEEGFKNSASATQYTILKHPIYCNRFFKNKRILRLYFEECKTTTNVIYSHSSFTNRCTFIKTFITIYIKIRWLLHVSVYDHHQGSGIESD
jgi:hypothetical protein